jgi:hypothetical protein
MRKWLQPLVDQYLQAVTPLQHSEDDRAQAITWANWMRQHWAQHGLADLKQQRNLMTDVRGVIKSHLGADHVALETMNLPSLNGKKSGDPDSISRSAPKWGKRRDRSSFAIRQFYSGGCHSYGVSTGDRSCRHRTTRSSSTPG